VNEYLGGGELFEAITHQGVFNEQKAALVVRQILLAAAYMHKKNIVHRDIKPENLRFDSVS
jgi:serine/threonine protein kinase